MPPKKAKSKAAVKPKAAAQPDPPSTTTTARGKEVENTAAAGRPKRSAAAPVDGNATAARKDPPKAEAPKAAAGRSKRAAPAPVDGNATAARKAPPKAEAPKAVSKKRGRPAKAATVADEAAEPPAKRGRKSAEKPAEPEAAVETKPTPAKRGRQSVGKTAEPQNDTAAEPTPAKRARGAAAGAAAPKAAPKATSPKVVPKKRGKPAAADEVVEPAKESSDTAAPSKKRGRPAAKPATEPAEVAEPPKKRGRQAKAKSTTVTTGDDAPTKQLKEELKDDVEKAPAETSKPEKGKGKRGATATVKPTAAPAKQSEDGVTDATTEKVYWLMKAEQEDRLEKTESGKEINTKFTIDDLREKNAAEPWDGVRNLVARNNMRAMKSGDWAFFYASGGKKGRQPGITGLMQVVKEAEPDWTVSDKDAYGYVENEAQRLQADGQPKWSLVHVEYRKKLSKPVTLKELQKHAGDGGALNKMEVLSTTRLSVTKVSEAEWNFIVEQLIEGYEHETEPGFNADRTIEKTTSVVVEKIETAADLLKSTLGLPSAESKPADPPTEATTSSLPGASLIPSMIVETTETIVNTIKSVLPGTGLSGDNLRAASVGVTTSKTNVAGPARRGRSHTPSIQPDSANPVAVKGTGAVPSGSQLESVGEEA